MTKKKGQSQQSQQLSSSSSSTLEFNKQKTQNVHNATAAGTACSGSTIGNLNTLLTQTHEVLYNQSNQNTMFHNGPINNGQYNGQQNQALMHYMSNAPSYAHAPNTNSCPQTQGQFQGQMQSQQYFGGQQNVQNANPNMVGTHTSTVQNTSGQTAILELIQQMNTQLNTKLSNIEASVSKLSSIESTLTSVCADVSKLKEDSNNFNKKCGQYDQFCEIVSDIVDDYTENKQETKRIFKSLCKENESLKEEISELKQDKLSLNEKLLELSWFNWWVSFAPEICVAISVSPHVCFILVLILISMFLR